MTTNDPTAARTSRRRLVVPLLSAVIGIAYFVAGCLGGDRFFAVFGLVLMLVLGAAFVVLSRYSETVAGLMDRRDERIARIDTDATTLAGLSLVVAVLVGFVADIAHGGDGSPYSMLGAIAGVTYVAAVVVLRLRR